MMVAVLISGSSAVAILSGAFGQEVRGSVVSIVIMLIPTAVGAIQRCVEPHRPGTRP